MANMAGCGLVLLALAGQLSGVAFGQSDAPSMAIGEAKPAAALPEQTLYSYHLSPPYLLDAGQQAGLTFDFAKHLNRHLKGWQVRVQLMDRPSLEAKLNAGEPALILWTRKAFFPDHQDLHSSRAIMFDSDIVIRPAALALQDLAGLRGKRLCQVTGLYYQPLEAMLSSGEIVRVDREGYGACVAAIAAGQADVAVVNNSYYLSQIFNSGMALVPIGKPISSFSRHILLTPARAADLTSLDAAIASLQRDPSWQATLNQYGAPNFVQLFELETQDLLELPVR